MPLFFLLLFLLPISAGAANDCQIFLKARSKLHIGTTTLASVWGEPLAVKLNKNQLLALAKVQRRYRINPDFLVALAAKESRLNCRVNADGCYQITPEALTEMGLPDERQNFGRATVIAARYLQASRDSLQARFNFKSFVRHAADREAEAKLLARAYNRGNFDPNLIEILTTRRAFCRDQKDLLTCFDSHAIARDHAQAVVSYCRSLVSAPTHKLLNIAKKLPRQ